MNNFQLLLSKIDKLGLVNSNNSTLLSSSSSSSSPSLREMGNKVIQNAENNTFASSLNDDNHKQDVSVINGSHQTTVSRDMRARRETVSSSSSSSSSSSNNSSLSSSPSRTALLFGLASIPSSSSATGTTPITSASLSNNRQLASAISSLGSAPLTYDHSVVFDFGNLNNDTISSSQFVSKSKFNPTK